MEMVVESMGKRGFKVDARGHSIMTDQSKEQGGEDKAPTPVELFVASLGTCIGVFATRYMRTAGLEGADFKASLDWCLDEKKTRVEKIDVSITVTGAELGERKNALLMSAGKCIIHNTLENPPEINIKMTEK